MKKVSGVSSLNADGLTGRDKISTEGETGDEEERKKLIKWTRDACYRMFICLGDLGTTLNHSISCKIATRQRM